MPGRVEKHRFSLTRIFSGTYREVWFVHITGNTLSSAAGRFVCPWAQHDAGRNRRRNKFDLTQWDKPTSAARNFVAQASQRGVVVELVFFCTMYDDAVWMASHEFPQQRQRHRQPRRNEVYGRGIAPARHPASRGPKLVTR